MSRLAFPFGGIAAFDQPAATFAEAKPISETTTTAASKVYKISSENHCCPTLTLRGRRLSAPSRATRRMDACTPSSVIDVLLLLADLRRHRTSQIKLHSSRACLPFIFIIPFQFRVGFRGGSFRFGRLTDLCVSF